MIFIMQISTRTLATFALYLASVSASVVQNRDENSLPAAAVVLPRQSTHTISDAVTSSFLSFSVDPAFWTEFFGNSTHPNKFTLNLLKVSVSLQIDFLVRADECDISSLRTAAVLPSSVREVSPRIVPSLTRAEVHPSGRSMRWAARYCND